MAENISPEHFLIQAMLVAGIILNFIILLKRHRLKPLPASISFLSSVLILTIAIPSFYGSFELSVQHFFEHISLKVLFIFVAIQIHLFKGMSALSGKAYQITERELFDRSIERTSAFQDAVEKVYETVEVGFFDRDLQKLSEKTASFLRDTLTSVEKAFNMFWDETVKKGEESLDMLRNIQTGLLSINLIFVITFLGTSLILIVLVWR